MKGETAGYTVLELVIVVLILGIVATLALPALNASFDDVRIYSASTEVVSALHFARNSAMGAAQPVNVAGNVPNDWIRVRRHAYDRIDDMLDPTKPEIAEEWIENSAEMTWVEMEHPAKPGNDYLVDFLNDYQFDGIDIISFNFGGLDTVQFLSDGTPADGGQIVIAYGNRQVTIAVDSVTGKITETF